MIKPIAEAIMFYLLGYSVFKLIPQTVGIATGLTVDSFKHGKEIGLKALHEDN